jgi:hypothetical protein
MACFHVEGGHRQCCVGHCVWRMEKLRQNGGNSDYFWRVLPDTRHPHFEQSESLTQSGPLAYLGMEYSMIEAKVLEERADSNPRTQLRFRPITRPLSERYYYPPRESDFGNSGNLF